MVLGDALAALGVRRTPVGRRRVMTLVQLPILVVFTLALVAVLIGGVPDASLPWLALAWLLVLVPTAVGYVVPWEAQAEIAGLVLGVVDLGAIAIVSGALVGSYPTVGAVQLLPVLIMSFSFGRAGTVLSILGGVFIAFAPYLVGAAPAPSTTSEWVSLLLTPAMVAVLAVAAQLGARLLRRVQARSERLAAASENQQTVTMTVLDALDVGTAFVRDDGTVAFTNRAFVTLIERAALDPETRAGTRVFESDGVTPIPPDQQMMAQAVRGEYFDSRVYVIGERGNQTTMLVTARPVVRADGVHLGSAFVSKDISELADSLRVRDEFLSVVSHELRTPLTSVIGYLEILEDELDADALGVREYLDVVSRNAQQLMLRIGDLLHVADRLQLQRTSVDIAALVIACVADARLRAHAASVALEVSAEGPLAAHVDEPRMRQVIGNLISNAVKYSAAGGRVDVMAGIDGDDVIVSVTDEGAGIADHELRHVFERFYRTTAARDAVIPGTGLGLSIVKDIVDAHGGEVSARSRVGSGSTFTVRVPVRLPA